MPKDRAKLIEVVLDGGAISKFIVEQEDHTQVGVSAGGSGSGVGDSIVVSGYTTPNPSHHSDFLAHLAQAETEGGPGQFHLAVVGDSLSWDPNPPEWETPAIITEKDGFYGVFLKGDVKVGPSEVAGRFYASFPEPWYAEMGNGGVYPADEVGVSGFDEINFNYEPNMIFPYNVTLAPGWVPAGSVFYPTLANPFVEEDSGLLTMYVKIVRFA